VNADIGKLAIVAAIMGVLLLGGLFLNQEQAPAPEVVPVEAPAPVVVPQLSLEMLGPAYSEKAVYDDEAIHIAFKPAITDAGVVKSSLGFWLHNISSDVVTVLWDRCSLQLPSGNTVNIVNGAAFDGISDKSAIAIAPDGDLFDSVIPISEITTDADGSSISTDVLDKGPFQFVLALEVGGDCSPQQIQYYTFRFVIR